MKQVMFIALFLGIITIGYGGQYAYAGKIDILINKLVEKGILSHSEADELLTEMQQEGDKQKEEIKQAASEAAKTEAQTSMSVPDWVKKMNFHGDLRLRHDTQWRDEPNQSYSRNRERYRLRFGFKTKATETTEVGVRLASGSGFQNTTNQSFDEHARGKQIFIDRVYASWKAADFLKIVGGKQENPLFTTPLVWDPDVNPEGISESFVFNISNRTNLFLNLGQWFIEEIDLKNESDSDPTLLAYQIGTEIKATDKVKLTFAGTYYDFMNMDEIRWKTDLLGDEEEFIGYNHKYGQQMIFDNDKKLVNEFGCFELGAKAEIKDVLPVPVYLFGNYIYNADADINDLMTNGVDPGPGGDSSDPADLLRYGGDDRDTGWLIGFSIGNKKKKGDWYAQYHYQVLEDYAFPAVFVDSDFHGGGTNNQGHYVQGQYFLLDNVQAGATGFFTERESESKDGKKDEDRIQLDMVINF